VARGRTGGAVQAQGGPPGRAATPGCSWTDPRPPACHPPHPNPPQVSLKVIGAALSNWIMTSFYY
jgi:hypothetical protein